MIAVFDPTGASFTGVTVIGDCIGRLIDAVGNRVGEAVRAVVVGIRPILQVPSALTTVLRGRRTQPIGERVSVRSVASGSLPLARLSSATVIAALEPLGGSLTAPTVTLTT